MEPESEAEVLTQQLQLPQSPVLEPCLQSLQSQPPFMMSVSGVT